MPSKIFAPPLPGSSTRAGLWRIAALVCGLLLAGCGGGGSDAPSSPNPAPASGPTAEFSAPAGAVAGTAVVFDAGPSLSPAGSALTYQWDFGDGTHGATVGIGKVFAAAGDYAVTLGVRDAAGALAQVTRSVHVTAGVAAGPQVKVTGLVNDVGGQALAGVAANVVGETSSVSSDPNGRLTISLASGSDVLLKLVKSGYADQFVPVTLPLGVGADGYFEARLLAREAPQTLADASAGGVLTGRYGVRLNLAAGSLVDSAGVPVSGPIQASLTPVDVGGAALSAFPGRFEGLRADASRPALVSYGTVEFVLTQGGAPLQLAPGRRASIDIPGFANVLLDGSAVKAGDVVPLWSLDETTGLWMQEGTGTVVASADSPTGFTLHAEVGHLSWWNWDQDFDASYKPKPKCTDSTNGSPGSGNHFADATVCNMLAQFDRGASGAAARARAQSVASVRPLAAAPAIKPGYNKAFTIPITGGTTVALPPNVPLLLLGSALNGTWVGRLSLSGGAADSAEVIVPLHPVAAAQADESFTLPFDQTRALGASLVSRFRFTPSGDKPVAINLQHGLDSRFAGKARLLQGSTVLASADFGNSGNATVLNASILPAADYVIEVTNTGSAGTFELQASYLHWATAAPPIIGFSQMGEAVLMYDSQGRAVEMNVESYTPAAGGFDLSRIVFRRLVDGAWSSAADTIELGSLGAGSPAQPNCIGFALDRNDQPAFIQISSDTTSYSAKRWSGSAWQAIGPNGGTLPQRGTSPLNFCPSLQPVLKFDASNAPIAAYAVVESRKRLYVQRFSGTAWTGLGPRNGVLADGLNSFFSGFAMTLDANGKPLVTWTTLNGNGANQPAYVVRYVDTPAPAWVGVGSADGLLPLPDVATNGYVYESMRAPTIALDGNGNPAVAFGVFVNTLTVGCRITAYRFDGTVWASAGLHAAATDSCVGGTFNGDGVEMYVDNTNRLTLAWSEAPESISSTLHYYAQTWNGVVWDGVGSGDGAIDNPSTVNSVQMQLAKNPAGNASILFLDSTAVPSLGLRVFVP